MRGCVDLRERVRRGLRLRSGGVLEGGAKKKNAA